MYIFMAQPLNFIDVLQSKEKNGRESITNILTADKVSDMQGMGVASGRENFHF